MISPRYIVWSVFALLLLRAGGPYSFAQSLEPGTGPDTNISPIVIDIPPDLLTGSTNSTRSAATNAPVDPMFGMASPFMDTNKVASAAGEFLNQLELARSQPRDKSNPRAARTLAQILESAAPTEIKRLALFELALVEQEQGQLVKAQQIYAQYIHVFPDDPSVPEILMRQGLLFRQMGVNNLAISKFYAVMSTCLRLKVESIDYYKQLVLRAQLEIAETYYLEGRYDSSAEYFGRLSKAALSESDREQIEYKRVRSLSYLTNYSDTIARGLFFLKNFTNSLDVAEVRFLLASALKQAGRNTDATRQVLLLLQDQQHNAGKNPELWRYWQQRAGNEIANQFYKEGDFLDALQIYLTLAELDASPGWQLPVLYQEALVYEQLQQPQKARDVYQRLLDRRKELTDADVTPSLKSLFEMAAWRRDYLAWLQQAQSSNESLKRSAMMPASTAAAP